MPLAVLESDAETEDQRLPLGDVVGPLVDRLTSSLNEPSLSWTVQAAVTGPGLSPPPSKWMIASFIDWQHCPLPTHQATQGSFRFSSL
jgi:hypothetical protein